MRKELEATGKEFDKVFGLDKEFKGSVIDIVVPERESSQIDLRKATIQELNALGTAAAKAEIERRQDLEKMRRRSGKETLKQEKELIDGTIAYLEQSIKQLEETLRNTPKDGAGQIIGDLTAKQNELKALNDELDKIKAAAQTEYEIRLKIESGGFGQVESIASGIISTDEIVSEAEKAAQEVKKVTQKSRAEQNADAIKKAKDLAQREIKLQSEKAIEQAKLDAERWENFKDLATSALSSISGAISDIRLGSIDREKDAALKAIDEEYQGRIKKAQGNQKLIDKLEKERDAKREAAEKEAARKRKQVAITESIIQTALAIVEALPNVFLAAAVGIAGAAQTAVIASQSFAKGGFTMPKQLNYAVGGFTGPGIAPPDSTGKRPAGSYAKPWGNVIYHENE